MWGVLLGEDPQVVCFEKWVIRSWSTDSQVQGFFLVFLVAGSFFRGFSCGRGPGEAMVGSMGKLPGEHEVAGVCPPSAAALLAKERSAGKRIFKSICVFCGSSSGKKDIFSSVALSLGRELVCAAFCFHFLLTHRHVDSEMLSAGMSVGMVCHVYWFAMAAFFSSPFG